MKHFIQQLKAVFILVLVSNSIQAQCTFTTTVPYLENFSSITLNNQLPNCSWVSSNPGITCQTYTANNSQNRMGRLDSKFGCFENTPAGTSYFYTNGIYLIGGVTYSTTVWYVTELGGSTNWTDLSILMGASQSSAAMNTVVSTNGSAFSPAYTFLTNTFSVATTGLYYFAIKATSNGSCCATYLSWDDFSVTLPCLSLTATSTLICQGQSATLTASDAHTYTWSTGSNSTSIVVSPTVNATYAVTGNNTLAACVDTKSVTIKVAQNPSVSIIVSDNPACSEKTITMAAYGASTFSWSTGPTTSTLSVVAGQTNTISVVGTDAIGCEGLATVQVTVLPSPTVTAVSSNTYICEGQVVTLSSSGATTYTWSEPGGAIQFGSAITVTLNSGTTYAVVGTGTNGCESGVNISLNISDCTGLDVLPGLNGIQASIFPNPLTNQLHVKTGLSKGKLNVFDMSGRHVFSELFMNNEADLNFGYLPAGLYYLQIESDTGKTTVKFSKE